MLYDGMNNSQPKREKKTKYAVKHFMSFLSMDRFGDYKSHDIVDLYLHPEKENSYRRELGK